MENLSVEIINQLSDNYSYLLFNNNSSSSIIVDPAEANSIINILKKKNLNLDYIFITHHHSDHTSGLVKLVKEYPKVKIFSPSELYSLKINKISDGDILNTSLNEFKILSTPGHTLDHIVLCDYNNNFLFCGDVLFRLGCGRIFEGTFEQMQNSLQKLFRLPDKMIVFCGHEYTKNNLNFLEFIFKNNLILEKTKNKILKDLISNGRSIPFNLGEEKKCNPFLNQECEMGSEFKKRKKYSNTEFFRYLRERKDNF